MFSDLVSLDENGYAVIEGRKKDMLIRGGENIYPVEIEQFLYENDKIEDAQVIGIPDERLGEEICAWIKLKGGQEATEQEIKDFCHGKISHFKIPKYILFVNEFPMTVTGKIQKFKMREKSLEMLNLTN